MNRKIMCLGSIFRLSTYERLLHSVPHTALKFPTGRQLLVCLLRAIFLRLVKCFFPLCRSQSSKFLINEPIETRELKESIEVRSGQVINWWCMAYGMKRGKKIKQRRLDYILALVDFLERQ